MVFLQILTGMVAAAICLLVIQRVRSESFPHGTGFFRVLVKCCGVAAVLGIVINLGQ